MVWGHPSLPQYIVAPGGVREAHTLLLFVAGRGWVWYTISTQQQPEIQMRVTRTDTSQVQISDVNVISVEKLGKVLEEQGLPLDTPFEVEYTAKGYYIKTVTFTNRTFRG